MKMSQEQIQIVALMLTDDPDIIVNEDVAASSILRKLALATKITDQRQLEALAQEFELFTKYRPSLLRQGDDMAVQAFIDHKKTGKMPVNRNLPSNMDEIGGKDFRPGV